MLMTVLAGCAGFEDDSQNSALQMQLVFYYVVPRRKRGVRPNDLLEASKQRSFSSSRTGGRVITEIVFNSQSRYPGRFVFYFSVFTCREYIGFG